MMPNVRALLSTYVATLGLVAAACLPEPPLAPAAPRASVVVLAPPASVPPESAAPTPTPPTSEGSSPFATSANATALGKAARPFATYLAGLHNRIHPLFADYLEGLNKDPRVASTAYATLEIVIDKRDGKLARVGVIRSSGVVDFDAAAFKTIFRAAPFGVAPDAIASPDGKVYVHWEFHRDPFDACSTRNARPFILKDAPVNGAP